MFINKNKCITKLWEKQLKKKVRRGPASFLKISLWDSSQFLLVQINLLVSPLAENLLQMGYSKQFPPLLQLLECLNGYTCDGNSTMKFPPDFCNYTGLNGFVNFFSQFTIAPPNKLILGCKSDWSAKGKKQHHVRSSC